MSEIELVDPETEQRVLVMLTGADDPEKVKALEEFALQQPQVDLQTSHVVHGGMCARTIIIPAGTVMTGALLNKDNIIVMVGDLIVTTAEGLRRLTGYHVLPVAKGFKRAGVILQDTYWTTFVRTDKTEIRDIEDEMTDESAQLQTRRAGIEFAPNHALEA
ncbi:MAG: hypothetical protein ACOY95_03200 [Pseudomonadota bacterium]